VMPRPNQSFEIREIELDAPRAGEVLVRIYGVGICHTDLVAAEGRYSITMPAVLGHEGAGVIEDVGPGVTKVKPGDQVVITFAFCGDCPMCCSRQPAYCRSMPALNLSGKRADGSSSLRDDQGDVAGRFFGQSSFASHALALERNVVKVPEGVPLEIAGPLGCGIQTGAGAIMRSMDCANGTSLAVLGGGAVGLSAIMAASLREMRAIILVEPSARRRQLALELGATHVIDPATVTDVAAAVRSALSAGADYVFDTSGLPGVINAVPKILAPRGVFGFVGVPPASAIDLGPPGTLREMMRGGFTYRGIIEGDSDPDVFLPELMTLYLKGQFPFDKLITTYPLSDINRAVSDQHQGLCIKPVLLP